MWLYKVIAFIGDFGFSSPKSGLKPRKGRGYAWNNWAISKLPQICGGPERGPKKILPHICGGRPYWVKSATSSPVASKRKESRHLGKDGRDNEKQVRSL